MRVARLSMRIADLAVFPLAPLLRLIAVGEALNRQAAELLQLGERTEGTLAGLDRSGRENVALATEMLEVGRASVEANREANIAIANLTERTDRLLTAMETIQPAAERVDRVASRIPGMRD
jgi:hypothetical protein